MSVLAAGDLLWSTRGDGVILVCAVAIDRCRTEVYQYTSNAIYPPVVLHGLGCWLQDWERVGWELVGVAWPTDTPA